MSELIRRIRLVPKENTAYALRQLLVLDHGLNIAVGREHGPVDFSCDTNHFAVELFR